MSFMRAHLCHDGPEAMRRDAQEALHGLSPVSSFRPSMIQVEGLSHLLEGDVEAADRFFARAVDEASSFGVRPVEALILADRGCAAMERGDSAAAGTFSDQALRIMHDGRFDDYWTSALVLHVHSPTRCASAVMWSGDDSSSYELHGSVRCSPTRSR